MDLGPIEADVTQFEQLHFLRQFQHLYKQLCEFIEEAAPERRQGVMIRMRVARDVAKSKRVIGGTFQPTTGEDAGGVAIDQDRQQRGRMVRL